VSRLSGRAIRVTEPACEQRERGAMGEFVGETGWDLRRLNGVDALMLYTETPEVHMHTLKVGVLDVSGVDGGFTFDVFRRVAYSRLMALAPLRYQLIDIPLKLYHPMWVNKDDIDLDYHLRSRR